MNTIYEVVRITHSDGIESPYPYGYYSTLEKAQERLKDIIMQHAIKHPQLEYNEEKHTFYGNFTEDRFRIITITLDTNINDYKL